MTRLTEQMIRDIPSSLTEYDAVLRGHIGVGLRQLAEASLGANDVDTGNWKVAAVPITSGQGSIGGFSLCISALAHHLGYRSLVTQNTDVSGLHEAMAEGADIIILADDLRFVA